jgi:GNAT superfamily N-acetyltransferase
MKQPVPLPACSIDGITVFEMSTGDVPLLQAFFDANPDYFRATSGEPAGPDEAHEEMHEPLPEGWPFTKQWRLGWRAADGALIAMANVTADLLAVGVWHIGLFIVATAQHGSGDAQKLYQDLERWAAANDAAWLRLGVVLGNTRAERFWERIGFQEVRRRHDIRMGLRDNTIRVMMKPLRGGTVAEYVQAVPRDRPDA